MQPNKKIKHNVRFWEDLLNSYENLIDDIFGHAVYDGMDSYYELYLKEMSLMDIINLLNKGIDITEYVDKLKNENV